MPGIWPTLNISESKAMARNQPESVSCLAGRKVLVLGDVMLDEYLNGVVERISPEAPVPVVQVLSRSHVPGGAGNVARNIAALGGAPTLVSIAGDDADSRSMRDLLSDGGIRPLLVPGPERRTTRKSRVIAQQQQMIRLDYETVRPLDSEESVALLSALAECLPEHEVLILSDYAKGLFTLGFMAGLRALLATKAPHMRVIVDPKPENISLFQGVWLLTPNSKEAAQCAGLPVKNPAEAKAAGLAMMRRLGCPHLAVTMGKDGMALFASPEDVWHIPSLAHSVYDVTGAGDTVIAVIALALASQMDLLPAALLANAAAGVTVSKFGAATVSPDELAEALSAKGLSRPLRL